MMPRLNRRRCGCAALLVLASCDPGVRIGWYQDVNQRIDPVCIRDSLKTIVGDVNSAEDNEVSGGISYYPNGSRVTSFTYLETSTADYIGVAKLPNGQTRYIHRWGRIGTSMSPTERARAEARMKNVDAALARRCGFLLTKGVPVSR